MKFLLKLLIMLFMLFYVSSNEVKSSIKNNLTTLATNKLKVQLLNKYRLKSKDYNFFTVIF